MCGAVLGGTARPREDGLGSLSLYQRAQQKVAASQEFISSAGAEVLPHFASQPRLYPKVDLESAACEKQDEA